MRARHGQGAVLFDLDGTLLDTAPDMVPALNGLLAEQGASALPYDQARAHVSNGAAGLLRLAFPGRDTDARQPLLDRYLALYQARLSLATRLFPGLEILLDTLDEAAIPWGVVTNKASRLTEPLLEQLGLASRAACIVSGDTTSERKPSPRPVQHALSELGARPDCSYYVGDARRDIEAGNAAGTITVAVTYGYIEPGQDPYAWGARHVVNSTRELHDLIIRELPPG